MKTEDKLLLKAIRGANVTRHPFWFMRQAGRYLPEYRALRAKAGSFMDLCFNSDLATEVTLQPIRRFGMDAAILFSDILVVPYGLGQNLTFQEGEGPKLPPIRDSAGINSLASSLDFERLAPIYETIKKVRQELPSETALIGFAGAPWTVATYMVEGGSSRSFDTIKQWARQDKRVFNTLIDRIIDATIAHLEAQLAAGVEVIQVFDSWAGVLDGEAFENWVLGANKRVVQAIKAKHPNLPVIGFPKGIGAQYPEYARATGVDMVAIDPDVPLAFARESLQPLVAVQGNLDPLLLVAGGPALTTRVKAILSSLGQGRFVFNLGHGVLPNTPLEHVAEVVDILRSTPARG